MYIRPLATTLSFARRSTVYTLRADLHNRRITVSWGRLGTLGRSYVFQFPTRDEARDFLEELVDRREALGYVRVA